MRATFASLILIASMGAASAQSVAPNGVLFGQSWTLPQDFSSLEMTQRPRAAQGSGTASDRAKRAARQAQFNRNFPGTPIRRTAG
jgi:hypothetical protein